MALVKLSQVSYNGLEKDEVSVWRGIIRSTRQSFMVQCHQRRDRKMRRLGVFGFPPGESDELSRGSLDVVRALEWVRETVEAFGGDAGDVTGFGESAGAFH